MTDPRATHSAPITAPPPLPHVSRRALAKITDPLPPITRCPYCANAVALVNNQVIYGRAYGEWPYAYHCRPCDAYVGLHPQTDIPLGTLATAPLRKLRKQAKTAFYYLQMATGKNRDAMHHWLSATLQIPSAGCHIGMFDEPLCKQVYRVCQRRLQSLGHTMASVDEKILAEDDNQEDSAL